jgi:hypothetical protein
MLDRLKKLLNRLTMRAQQAEPEIKLFDDGFTVVEDAKTLFRVRWPDVKEIFAFKLDLLTTDCVCLGFRISETSEYLRVNEEMPGYSALVEEMQRVFPDYNHGWWMQVAFPAFATNFTPVWGKPLPITDEPK